MKLSKKFPPAKKSFSRFHVWAAFDEVVLRLDGAAIVGSENKDKTEMNVALDLRKNDEEGILLKSDCGRL